MGAPEVRGRAPRAVPATESQGRIHTSTTGVLVFPEVDEPEEIQIDRTI
ncbi:hypothetical protein [Microbacterium sp.]